MKKLLLLLIFALTAGKAELVIVASKESPLHKLSKKEVSRLFLAKTRRLQSGQRITPVELAATEYKAEFYRHIAKKSLSQLHAYWTTVIFTGKGKPPKALPDKSSLIRLLTDDHQTISYLPAQDLDPTLKVLYRCN